MAFAGIDPDSFDRQSYGVAAMNSPINEITELTKVIRSDGSTIWMVAPNPKIDHIEGQYENMLKALHTMDGEIFHPQDDGKRQMMPSVPDAVGPAKSSVLAFLFLLVPIISTILCKFMTGG